MKNFRMKLAVVVVSTFVGWLVLLSLCDVVTFGG